MCAGGPRGGELRLCSSHSRRDSQFAPDHERIGDDAAVRFRNAVAERRVSQVVRGDTGERVPIDDLMNDRAMRRFRLARQEGLTGQGFACCCAIRIGCGVCRILGW